MRSALILLLVLAVAGCGSSSSAPSPTATPSGPQQWSSAPKVTIDSSKMYTATVSTDDGSFVITLLPKVAPITVNNFVFLARHHFYHHILIHRIISTFMFQTGDPLGTGAGGPGYAIPDEKVTLPYTLGTVAMANAGPNTGGSQFFVILAKSYQLAPNYTIFGKVTSGFSVLQKIGATPVQASNGELSQPINDLYVHDITIHVSG